MTRFRLLLVGLLAGVALALPALVGASAPPTGRATLSGSLAATAPPGAEALADAAIVDSLGASHPVTFRFVQAFDGARWDWEAFSDDPSIASPSPLAAGSLYFENGRPLTDPDGPEGTLRLSYTSGATEQAVRIDLDHLRSQGGHSALTATAIPGQGS